MEHAIAVALGSSHARSASFPTGHSAEVVVFPRSFARSAEAPLAPLLNATERLQAAACAQKAAVAAWRGSLGEAAQSLAALESSMRRYESRLAALTLKEIGAKSRELAAIMDQALTVKG